MSLADLPNELLLSVAGNLELESDINALARTIRSVYLSVSPYLYKRNVERSRSSALFWAAENGQEPAVHRSLDAGANVRARRQTSSETTALHLASAKGHTGVMVFLLTRGARLNARNGCGHTALHLAILSGHEFAVRILMESGANSGKSWPGFFNQTALHVASFYGFTSIVQILLEDGANIESRDAQLQTPLHWAVKVDAPCEEDFITLNDPCRYFASQAKTLSASRGLWKGNLQTVRLLLEHHANLYARDRSGRDPGKLAKTHPDAGLRQLFKTGFGVPLAGANLHGAGTQKSFPLAKR